MSIDSVNVVTNVDLIMIGGLILNFFAAMGWPIKIEKKIVIIETKLSPIYKEYIKQHGDG